MQRSKSSSKWLKDHFDDFYVKQAQKFGYRSRAVYKLKEVNEKERLLSPNMKVIDLGAAPGGWSQYVSQCIGDTAKIVAVDLLSIDALPNVEFICGDFTEDEVVQKILNFFPTRSVDLILSDMAPNMSGNAAIDIPRAMHLAELALDFSFNTLKPGGTLFMKVFHGSGFDALIKLARDNFAKVIIKKPKASRQGSRETYLLAKDYKLK
jgi:23S rRNA (uridine2552-2'-O)-methyltransferase